jgi:rhomboid family GlyGly-CTERM serine protease
MTIRVPWIALGGAAIAIVAALVPAVGVALQLDRAAVADGEYWRLLTGHFAHWSSSHFAWDTLAFLACGAIVEMHSRWEFVTTVIASAFAVAVTLLVFVPNLGLYRGLSGVDSALFVTVIGMLGQRAWSARSWIARAVLVVAALGFTAKMIAELITGHVLFVDTSRGILVVPQAHVFGAVVGIAIALLRDSWRRLTPSHGQSSGPGGVFRGTSQEATEADRKMREGGAGMHCPTPPRAQSAADRPETTGRRINLG